MSLRIDAVQHRLATAIANEVSGSYGVPLEVEAIEVRGLNDLRLKNVLIRDLAGDTLICADEARAYLQTPKLLKSEVRVSTLIFSAPDIRLNRATPDAPLNIQFIIDIVNGNKKGETSLDLRINQLLVYDGHFAYDVKSELPDSTRFDSNHIEIVDFCCNVSLKKLYKDELDLIVRSVSGEEKCGFRLDRLRTRVKRNGNRFQLKNLELGTPLSNVASESLELVADSLWSDFTLQGDVRSDGFTAGELALFMDMPDYAVPQFKFDVDGFYSRDSVDVAFSAAAIDGCFDVAATASLLSPFTSQRKGVVTVENLSVNNDVLKELLKCAGLDKVKYDVAGKLGDISMNGETAFRNDRIDAKASLSCRSGKLSVKGTLFGDGNYNATVKAKGLRLDRLAGMRGLGKCNVTAEASGNVRNAKEYATLAGCVTDFKYNDYTYAPIDFEGSYTEDGITAKVTADDANLKALLTAKYSNTDVGTLKFALKADSLKPYNLHLLETAQGQEFAFSINGDYIDYGAGKTIVNARVDNFSMTSEKGNTFIRNFYVTDNKSGEERLFVVASDFLEASIYGRFDFPTVFTNLADAVKSQLTAFDASHRKSRKKKKKNRKNEFYYDVEITSSKPLTDMFGLPVTILEPSRIFGEFSDSRDVYKIDATVNKIDYKGTLIRSLSVLGKSTATGVELNAQIQKPFVKNADKSDYKNLNEDIVFRLNANVSDNNVSGIFNWNNFKEENVMNGVVRLDADFSRDDDGDLCMTAKVYNDSIIHKNAVWHIEEGFIAGKMDSLVAKNIGLHNDRQSLRIDGVIGREASDSLNIYLDSVEISTLFDLINFRILRFGGKATGTAYLTGILSEFNADSRIDVNDFSIDGAVMGRGDIRAGWDAKTKSILLDVGIYNRENELSSVKGLLSQANDTISLMIDANNLNVAFLNEKMGSFMSETEGSGSGKVHLHGSWRAIDFDGAVALNCATKVKATNVKYYFTGDSIRMSKGTMAFDNARLYDRYGNGGRITGALWHKNLSQWTCTFNVQADDLLVYDTEGFGTLPFYGTVYGKGDALIKSDDGGFYLKAEISSAPNSNFVYNSNAASGARDNSFITFNDEKLKKKSLSLDNVVDNKKVYNSTASKLTLDFLLDVNENLQLKVFTNVQNDDYISLYGTGTINAVYNDKNGFGMQGHLDLARGTYKFTIQDVFSKVFDIMKGGTIAFNGDPYKAELDLKTKYLVKSASLRDLTAEITKSNDVEVNCVMNITGSLESPNLDFDLELPKGSEEERELLASVVSTPDQKNMQFVYLLGVGKFYRFDSDNGAEVDDVNSSTAVESLISNTISSQISNMFGKIIDNRNWNVSGNISTSERGWNSMEVDGMLRGRMFNDRLLINGNVGYRENPIANRNVIGDFELIYLVNSKYNWSIKAYSKTNDRYFSKTDLTTQGVGTSVLFEFDSWKWWGRNKDKDKGKEKGNKKVKRKKKTKQTSVSWQPDSTNRSAAEQPSVIESPDSTAPTVIEKTVDACLPLQQLVLVEQTANQEFPIDDGAPAFLEIN